MPYIFINSDMTGVFLLSNGFPSYLFCMFLHKRFTATKNIVDEIRFMYTEHLKNLIMKQCNKMLLSHVRVSGISNM